MTQDGPPGVWQPGDDPGGRQFVQLSGEAEGASRSKAVARSPEVTVAYETWGTLERGTEQRASWSSTP